MTNAIEFVDLSGASLPPSFQRAVNELRSRPAESFFIGPDWLDAGLATWPRDGAIRIARLADPFPALALIGRGTRRSRLKWAVRMIALNETLARAHDQTTMECNGFFGGDPARFGEQFDALVQALLAQNDWDELRVAGVDESRARIVREVAARRELRVETYSCKPTYWVDLDAIRQEHQGDYYAALSSNTRQQLRRALRAAQKDVGPVVLTSATTVEQALEWFGQIAPYHRARWGAGPENTGFDNPVFVEFHCRLIRSGFPEGRIEILKIEAGSTILSYLYNFVTDGRVYFYLGGVNYDVDAKFKPGMLAHLLAIQHHLARGSRIYNFLAGGNRYKESLSTDRAAQEWLILQRPRLRLTIERSIKQLRDRYRHRSAPANAGDSD